MRRGGPLISLFAFPGRGRALPDGKRVSYGGHSFPVSQLRGAEVVIWKGREIVFALVSTVSRDALLECAATVLRERLSSPSGRT